MDTIWSGFHNVKSSDICSILPIFPKLRSGLNLKPTISAGVNKCLLRELQNCFLNSYFQANFSICSHIFDNFNDLMFHSSLFIKWLSFI